MSAGHFDYKQRHIQDIADSIDEASNSCNHTIDGWHYSPDTIAHFNEAATFLRRAALMAELVDRLLSGDDSEETFIEEWTAAFGSRPL